MTMSHRERTLSALDHREPDRVPMDLGSTRNTGIIVEAYEALVEYLGLDNGDSAPEGFGQTKIARVADPSEAVLQKLGVDVRGLYLGKPDRQRERVLPDGSHEDELGVVRRKPPGSYYYDIVHSPFDRETTVEDLRRWPWPDPTDPGYTRGLRERALALRATTDCAIALHLQDIIVHPSQFLRGFERWYMSFILEPETMEYLLDVLLELRMQLAVLALGEVGDLVDIVSSSDDVADQRGPLISPEMYRSFIKPRHRRYFDAIRSHSRAKILYHSCGSVASLIPDFIDIGVDVINPVQVSAEHMDTSFLKKAYGNKVGFWGAIDTMRVLPLGTVQEVRAEVKRRVEDLAPGGGFVLAAVHNIQPNVPPQNVVAMFNACAEFGTYPISSGV